MYLPDDILALTDRIGMWHSLELRVPFVDHTLVEFCARIPSRMKIRRGEKKYLLRKAAAPFLPPSVLNHRKQGFASPMAMWLRGGLRDFAASNLSEKAISEAGVLLPERVSAVMTAHHERREMNDKQVFAMLMFQRWFRGIGSGGMQTNRRSDQSVHSVTT
jgi:asparagine synthase (glutamine-hydrolysing)